MLLQIDGWFAGGKSALWSLLDGHEDIFVNPVHDYSYALFLDKLNDDEWINKKHCTALRKILNQSEYYKFEKLYNEKKYQIHFSIDKIMDVDYYVDFYEFDKLFFSKLNDMKEWNIELIIHTLYQTYFEIYNKGNKNKYPKYYASMSHPGLFRYYENIPLIMPNMKSIVVKRDIMNIIATRMNRKERANDLNKFQAFSTPLKKIIDTKEINKILNYFEIHEELQRKYPSQFLVVDFKKLITETEKSMKDIAKFLDIEYDSVLSIPTRDAILLEYDGVSFIGKENDTYENLLSPNEIKIIQNKIDTYKKDIDIEDVNIEKNRSFYRSFNHLLIDLDVIARKFNNILIYGDCFLSNTIAEYLGKKVVGVISSNQNNISIQLSKKEYDVILITTMGEEEVIYNKLVCEYNVKKEEIIYINV